MSTADIRGHFVWHELMTTDPDAAATFYSSIAPWKTQPSGMPSYTLFMSGEARAGGLMNMPDGDASGTPPHWIVYVGTPDVDATVDAAVNLGGKVLKSASDIPDVGRFAVVADPDGAAFAAFTPKPPSTEGVPTGRDIGDFVWHELTTLDVETALGFYTELFGWEKGVTHDMGAMGVYQIVTHGGVDVGGIWKARDATSAPSWLSYVRVPDVTKAAAAVKAGGGRVLHGPAEVPGGQWIVMLLDPQGGAFAVVESADAEHKSAQPAAKAKPAAVRSPKPKTPPKPAMKPSTAQPAPAKPAAKTVAAPTAAKKKPKKKAAAKKAVVAKTRAATKKSGRKLPLKKPLKKKAVVKRGAAKKSAGAKRKSVSGKSAKRAKRPPPKSVRGKARKKVSRR